MENLPKKKHEKKYCQNDTRYLKFDGEKYAKRKEERKKMYYIGVNNVVCTSVQFTNCIENRDRIYIYAKKKEENFFKNNKAIFS